LRRILTVLTIAALMAAMMVSAGPAKADVSFGGSSVDVDVGDGFFGFDVGDGDDDDADGFTNRVVFIQSNSELDDFRPGGIAFV
jgi:hypothetical protein